MPAIATYDLKQNDLILGGVLIEGYGADDAIEYERAAAIGEVVVGADGNEVFNRNNNKMIFVRVHVLETSQGYRNLATLMAAQEAQTAIADLAYLHRDRINGDEVTSRRAVFVEGPVPSKGRAAGTRNFRLALSQGLVNAKFGALIT